MTSRPIGENEFDALLAAFERTAFRWECQPRYALDYEQADFDLFLAGTPVPPPGVAWWRPWLDQVAQATVARKRIGRVRILDDPPTDYQRWMRWADPWHARAGERIRYVYRQAAEQAGLPLDHDWWLLDSEQMIDMRFTTDGAIAGKTLVTDPDVIRDHIGWRNLAVRLALTTETAA